jgi:hypothetical protein
MRLASQFMLCQKESDSYSILVSSYAHFAMPVHNYGLVWTLLLLSVTIGCGGGGSGAAAVSGKITHKGKPLAKANVSFTPVDGASRAAAGLTDESGYYKLGTFSTSDGALPGKYRVAIIARGPDRPLKPGEMGSGMPGETMPGDALIPMKYFAPDSSGLTFEVKKGSNTADFDLAD